MGRQVVGAVLVALIFLGSLVAFTPLAPQFPAAALDSGWAFALNVAVAKGLVFGRDIVFTFGPYASTYTEQYHPATDVQGIWSGALLAGALGCALVCLSRGAGRIAAAALALFLSAVARDALFLIVPFAFLLLACRTMMPRDHAAWISFSPLVRFTLALLAIALSLAALVKGTFALAAAAMLALGLGLLARRGRVAVATGLALLFAGSMPLFWVLAGQPVAALPGFFIAGGPIVSGYTDAMSIAGVGGHPSLFLGCCLIVGLIYARFFARGEATGAVLFAGCAFILFLAFKAGFVRQDWHVTIAVGTLVEIAWMLALATPRLGAVVALVVAFAGWSIVLHDAEGIGPGALPGRIALALGGAAHAFATRVTAPDGIPWSFEDSLNTLRAEQSLPKLVGSVDIYSYGQSVLLARDPQWAPRPVLQSYSAYTPDLERLNAAHLTGADAPDNILFAVQPIDRRLAALEDGLSWPEILTRYDFAEMRGDLAVFHRRSGPPTTGRPIGDAPIAGGSFQLGQLIPVPANAPAVWAHIVVTPTLLGKLAAFAFKPPELTIWYQFSDGTERHFRYIPAMGAAGFVVSPLVETTTDFVALEAPAAASYFAGRRPSAIVVAAAWGEGTLWASSFSVDFHRLDIPAQPISRTLFDRVVTVRRRPAPPLATTPCAIDLLDRPAGTTGPIGAGRFLRVVAWDAGSDAGAGPDEALLVLRPRKGRVRIIHARPTPRGDVGGYVDLPPDAGRVYSASADTYGLTGDYLLGLEFGRGGRAATCPARVALRFGSGRATKRLAASRSSRQRAATSGASAGKLPR